MGCCCCADTVFTADLTILEEGAELVSQVPVIVMLSGPVITHAEWAPPPLLLLRCLLCLTPSTTMPCTPPSQRLPHS